MKNALLFTKLSSIFVSFNSCGWVIKLAAYIEITCISEWKLLENFLRGLENSQIERRKRGQALMHVTSYRSRLFFGKQQQLHELGHFLNSDLNLPVILRQSFATNYRLKLSHGVIEDAPGLQNVGVFLSISLPCCLLCSTGSRRGRTSCSSTNASSLKSTKSG